MDGHRKGELTYETAWPDHVGVAGISLHSASATRSQRLATTAVDAVTAWSHRNRWESAAPQNTSDFPFPDVLDHYRAVGRIAASALLVGNLARLNVRPATASLSGARELLARWLRSATDQLDGDYHTYAGTSLHEALISDAPFGTPERTTDVLILVLLVDLLGIEADALMRAPSRRQSKRTHAVIHAARRINLLAPEAVFAAPELSRSLEAVHLQSADEQEIAEQAAKAADRVEPLAPATHVANLTLLPVTPLHDEQMFLRSIQMFECLYLQTASKLESAAAALEARDPGRAIQLLTDVARRLGTASALYRVLTTMPPEIFAIIRKHTAGRSAVQSLAYRRVEQASAPSQRGGNPAPPAGPTLQEAWLRAGGRLPAETVSDVREAMKRVDDEWCALKRSHWGITLKTIGSLPGTGGTSGADYLYTASQRRLFPGIDAPD